MRSVFTMEEDGISNACMLKVTMNNPVTRTTAIELMNSMVVSFFSSGFSFSFSLGNQVLSASVILQNEGRGSSGLKWAVREGRQDNAPSYHPFLRRSRYRRDVRRSK